MEIIAKTWSSETTGDIKHKRGLGGLMAGKQGGTHQREA